MVSSCSLLALPTACPNREGEDGAFEIAKTIETKEEAMVVEPKVEAMAAVEMIIVMRVAEQYTRAAMTIVMRAAP